MENKSDILIIPNGIHTKSRLFDITMSNTTEELVIPSVDLNEALLVVGQG
jgi:hypothetical protein